MLIGLTSTYSGSSTPIGEPSFADALAMIAASDTLSLSQKRYWSTSLRQMSCYLDRPLTTIPARIAAIAGAVRKLHPESLGVHGKTFANHRANVRAALLWFNRQTLGNGRNAPMASHWRALWDRIGDRHAKDVLSPFLRYLTACAVEPDEVSDEQVKGFIAHRKETGFGDVKRGWHRALVRRWNNYAGRVIGWPAIRLTEPSLAKRFSGPSWDDFPEGLRAGIDAYCARIARRRKGAKGQILRPCASSTIAMRRRELIAAVRAAIEAGIALNDLQSLANLLHPDRVEAVIDYYWQKNGDAPSLYTIELAWRFLSLARNEPGFDPNHLDRLEEIRSAVAEHRQTGLTEKNRALVRHVIQSNAWSKVVALPERMMAEARSGAERQPIKSAITAQVAVAIRILTIAPIRVKNLAAVRLGLNLVRPGGPGTNYLLVFPDCDVKNRVPLEFPLDAATSGMIDDYLHRHRPHLLRGRDHEHLFPGTLRDCKTAQDLGEQISKRIWKELGLEVTPHQFRHAAAAIMLTHEPGNYELVRRVLGHRNIQTTTNFYVGLETSAAARRFGEMVTAMDEPPPRGFGRKAERRNA